MQYHTAPRALIAGGGIGLSLTNAHPLCSPVREALPQVTARPLTARVQRQKPIRSGYPPLGDGGPPSTLLF